MVIIAHQSSKSTFGANYNLLIHFLQEEMNEMVSHSVPFWGKTLDQDQDYLVTQLDDLSPFYCDLGIDQKRCQRYE